MSALLVALGAAVGAPLRYLVGLALDRRVPWGTLTVNLVGSFVLGLLVGEAIEGRPYALLGIGFCGGLTTYSSFAVQSVGSGQSGQSGRSGRRSWAVGASYAVGTVVGCLALATLGHLVGSALP